MFPHNIITIVNILNRILNRFNSYRKISIINSTMTSGNKLLSIDNTSGEVLLKNTSIFYKADYNSYIGGVDDVYSTYSISNSMSSNSYIVLIS